MVDKGHLVVGVFETEAAAATAADWLSKWQKTQKDVDDIKVDAMAVLTADDDKEIRIQRVGRHSAAGGAGIGLAVGALAGVLTGGLSVLGGLAAGALIGGVGGGLIHKGLGKHEEELADLTDHLCSGRAGVALVVDESAVEAVTEQLVDLGAITDVYTCPLEVLEKAQEKSSQS